MIVSEIGAKRGAGGATERRTRPPPALPAAATRIHLACWRVTNTRFRVALLRAFQ
jgi:hypothetical protein